MAKGRIAKTPCCTPAREDAWRRELDAKRCRPCGGTGTITIYEWLDAYTQSPSGWVVCGTCGGSGDRS